MPHWKWRVTKYEGPNGLLYEIRGTDGRVVTNGGVQSPLDILGDHAPTMPSSPLNEAEFLRWKLDEIEKGNRVTDLFN